MLIIANWKAYIESVEKGKKLFAAAKRLSAKHEIVLAPPAPFLGILAHGNRSKVSFIAQDISRTTGGAQTGENTAAAIREAGATYALIGHSERRAMGEDNALVAKKLQHALAQGLTPVLCIGERERDAEGQYLAFLREEIESAFASLSQKERLQVVIAYEPIWAIGKSAAESITATDLTEMVLYIRKVLADLLPGRGASRARVLYGGSVEPENARALAQGSGIDGFLVGRASVEPDSFAALVKAVTV